ncbi:unnamed protein product [Darwinula stevensoni]|uniref:KxDL domain-containing protein n=1 Tax=Darwinula stevensoni TaxID=69355 RepID=A0A7R8XAJ4_9CRUS|nr:unnamed protein product [Darwinula stevensoni]CAG0891944.1 unnamed protein product [Darwinula stevensoni]
MAASSSSPDSGVLGIDFYQNYTASEVFVQGIARQVNQEDVETIISAQKTMLQRFEKTNEMLSNCNVLSTNRYQNAIVDFRKHLHVLTDMKKDLDFIFQRIRIMKAKLEAQRPTAFAEVRRMAATVTSPILEPEEEEDDEQEKDSSSTSDSDDFTTRRKPGARRIVFSSSSSDTMD